MTCDFQQCGISISVDSGEPVQPHFKLRNPKRCSISTYSDNILPTSNGSDIVFLSKDCLDESVHMRRFVKASVALHAENKDVDKD